MADIQPPDSTITLDALLATLRSIWQIFLAPFAVAMWGGYRWLATRSDAKEVREARERDKLRASLDTRQTAYLDRLERNLARALARVDEVEERADDRVKSAEDQRDEAKRSEERAWDVTRGWKVRCHDLKHLLANAQALVNGLLLQSGKPERDWPDETLPALENIVGDNVLRAVRRRQPTSSDPADTPE